MTLNESWEGFAADAVPPGAPEGQRRAMRRAFYAGAVAVINSITALGGDCTEDDACELGRRHEEELAAFWREVREGRA